MPAAAPAALLMRGVISSPVVEANAASSFRFTDSARVLFEPFKPSCCMIGVANGFPDRCFDGRESQSYQVDFDKLLLIFADLADLPIAVTTTNGIPLRRH